LLIKGSKIYLKKYIRQLQKKHNIRFLLDDKLQGNVNYDDINSSGIVYIVNELNPSIPVYSVMVNIFDETQLTKIEQENTKLIHVDYLPIKIKKPLDTEDDELDLYLYKETASSSEDDDNDDNGFNTQFFDNIFYQMSNLLDNFFGSQQQQPFVKVYSVIVWDLDDTLVDYNLDNISSTHILEYMRKLFDFQVLWSHGLQHHVKVGLEINNWDDQFDLVLTRSSSNQCTSPNKGLGKVLRELNRKHNVKQLYFSVLVDDTESNFVNDYDYFVHIPKTFRSLRKSKSTRKEWLKFLKPHIRKWEHIMYNLYNGQNVYDYRLAILDSIDNATT